jgi:prepilin-type processing-associated H-X9-DG protein
MDEERRDQPEEQAASPQPESAPEGAARTSGMAVASLVLGILVVTALPGLILGIIALNQIGKNPQRLKGRGLALAGTIVSAAMIVLLPIIAIMAAILLPTFARARATAQKANCINNIEQISLAMQMYASDWNETYPLAENWNDALAKYARPSASGGSAGADTVWTCPTAKSSEPAYALNRLLARVRVGEVSFAAETVGIYESVPGRNQAGEAELLPSPPRHDGGNNIGFADGHAQWMDASQTGTLRWDALLETPPGLMPVPPEAPAPSG